MERPKSVGGSMIDEITREPYRKLLMLLSHISAE
jgi:hypothetical protein